MTPKVTAAKSLGQAPALDVTGGASRDPAKEWVKGTPGRVVSSWPPLGSGSPGLGNREAIGYSENPGQHGPGPSVPNRALPLSHP